MAFLLLVVYLGSDGGGVGVRVHHQKLWEGDVIPPLNCRPILQPDGALHVKTQAVWKLGDQEGKY